MRAVAVPGVAYAEANHSRWIVRCPAPWCFSAMQVRPRDGFVCAGLDGCGLVADVVWPDDTAVIEELLGQRPHPATRNWLPGESTYDLLLENLRHGLSPVVHPELGASASRILVDGSDGQVRVRLLDEPRVIDTAPRPEIGA